MKQNVPQIWQFFGGFVQILAQILQILQILFKIEPNPFFFTNFVQSQAKVDPNSTIFTKFV